MDAHTAAQFRSQRADTTELVWSDFRASPSNPLHAATLVAVCVVLSLSSIWVQGFSIGIWNNAFHIPIVLRLIDLPEFADDAFYQSLRNFVAPLWQFLALLSDERTIGIVFFAVHLLARVAGLTMIALLVIWLGCSAIWQVGATLILIAFSPLMMGATQLGAADLFVGYLTHSELVHPLIFGAFAALAFRRSLWSYACVGALFNTNVFVGVWTGFTVAVAQVLLLRRDDVGLWALRREFIWPTCVALILAAPTLLWTLGAVRSAAPAPPGFDFRAFLIEYFPNHSILQVGKCAGIIAVAGKLGTIALALLLVRGHALMPEKLLSALAALSAGATLLFALGVVTPFVTASMLLLNLQLIRAELIIHLLAVICAIVPLLLYMRSSDLPRPERPAVIAHLLCLVVGFWAFMPVTLAALTFGDRLRQPRFIVATSAGALALAAGGYVAGVELAEQASPGLIFLFVAAGLLVFWMLQPPHTQYVGAGRLQLLAIALAVFLAALAVKAGGTEISKESVAANFQPIAAFVMIAAVAVGHAFGIWSGSERRWFAIALAALVSMIALQAGMRGLVRLQKERSEAPQVEAWMEIGQWARRELGPGVILTAVRRPPATIDIQWVSRHPLWVNYRQGAAVMWWPAFYSQWHERSEETKGLHSLADQLAYACSKKIPYVLTDAPEVQTAPAGLMVRKGPYRLYAVATDCSTN